MSQITKSLPNQQLTSLKRGTGVMLPVAQQRAEQIKSATSAVVKAVTNPEFQEAFMSVAKTGMGLIPTSIFAAGFAAGKHSDKHGK